MPPGPPKLPETVLAKFYREEKEKREKEKAEREAQQMEQTEKKRRDKEEIEKLRAKLGDSAESKERFLDMKEKIEREYKTYENTQCIDSKEHHLGDDVSRAKNPLFQLGSYRVCYKCGGSFVENGDGVWVDAGGKK